MSISATTRPSLVAFALASLLLAGCVSPDAELTASVTEADPTEADAAHDLAWRTASSAALGFAEVATVVARDRIIVIGGFSSAAAILPTVHAYDPEADTWSALPPYPLPVHHVQAVAIDDTIYAFGGFVTQAFMPGTLVSAAGPGGWPRTDLAFKLAPGADAWEPIASLPVARAAGAAAVHDGRIHLVSGIGPTNERLAQTHVYDPATDSYAEAAPIPTPRDHLSLVEIDGRLFAAAGRVPDRDGILRDLPILEIYDPETDSWSEAAPASLGRGGQAGLAYMGRLVLLGGERLEGEFTVYDDVHAYDPVADEWTEWPALPTPLHGHGGAVWKDRLYVLGGTTWGIDGIVGTARSLGPSE